MADPDAVPPAFGRRPERVTDPILHAVVREATVAAKRDILRQATVPQVAHVLLAGHTYRYRLLPNGLRQITAILYPGDLCDLEAVMHGRAEYGVGTLTACRLGEIPIERVRDAWTDEPALARELSRHMQREAAIAREWLVNVGRRPALQRMAHLFCETHARKAQWGIAHEDGYDACLTQADLADALGLTGVHINRVLRTLRERSLIRREKGRMTLLDVPALEALAGFDPSYLQ